MSQHIEKIFKSALQNEEVAFDPQAWESMSARLDKVMPVNGGKGMNYWIAAGVAIVVGVGAAVYFMDSTPKDTIQTQPTVGQVAPVEKETIVSENKQNTATAAQENVSLKVVTEQARPTQITNTPIKPIAINENASTGQIKELVPAVNTPQSNEPSPARENSAAIVLPKLIDQCQGEMIVITNSNKTAITLQFPNGKKLPLEAGETKKIGLNQTGTYTLSSTLSKSNETFLVKASPAVDFEVNNYDIFEKGVPTVQVSAIGSAKEYDWSLKGTRVNYSGQHINLHLFRKGLYELELTTTHNNGCQTTISKTITIADNYNLMAMNAFNPNDNDIRNTTFMPYALKERNTDFEMIILDPRDGNLLYKTSDANAGWDGIDRRTGKIAASGVDYIWKVVLMKPLQGESRDYTGVVTITK